MSPSYIKKARSTKLFQYRMSFPTATIQGTCNRYREWLLMSTLGRVCLSIPLYSRHLQRVSKANIASTYIASLYSCHTRKRRIRSCYIQRTTERWLTHTEKLHACVATVVFGRSRTCRRLGYSQRKYDRIKINFACKILFGEGFFSNFIKSSFTRLLTNTLDENEPSLKLVSILRADILAWDTANCYMAGFPISGHIILYLVRLLKPSVYHNILLYQFCP